MDFLMDTGEFALTFAPGNFAGAAIARGGRAAVREFLTDPDAFLAARRGGLSGDVGQADLMRLADESVADALDALPTLLVDSPRLQNIVDNLYKGAVNSNRVGTGTTADAIRSELASGLPTAGRMHIVKGQESIRALERWLRRNVEAPTRDRMVAQTLLDDLRSARGGM